MNIEIKKINPQEIDKVCEILANVIAHMRKIGFTQWDEGYPRRDILEADIARKDLYGAYIGDTLAGFTVINNYQDSEYESIKWLSEGTFFVIHRLQVDPTFRGQGIAYALMLYAEQLAKSHNGKAIRLDTRFDNIPAIKLYEKLGYVKRGIVHFPRMMEYEFICFEKRIF